jgi:hypothetical protein
VLTLIRREEIGERGISDNHGQTGSQLVHNAFDYQFDAPALTSDSYPAQPSAQLSSYNAVEAQDSNHRINQLGDSIPVMDHHPTSLSGSFGSQHNSQHDITREYQAAHAFETPSTSQPMSLHAPSTRDLVSLPGISDLRYSAHRQPDESATQYVIGDPAGYSSEIRQQLGLHRQHQYSQGDNAPSYGHQDGYPSRQQGDRWRQSQRAPESNDVIPLERYHMAYPSQFQQSGHWTTQEASISASNVPLHVPPQVSSSYSTPLANHKGNSRLMSSCRSLPLDQFVAATNTFSNTSVLIP